MSRIIVCAECGEERPHEAKGLCSACYQRAQRSVNFVRIRERDRANYAANIERERQIQRTWCNANADWVRERKRIYYAANIEQERENQRARRTANSLHLRAASRNRYAADPIKKLERNSAWAAANPEKRRLIEHRREARKRSLPATLTPEQWTAIQVAYDHRCAYCGVKSDRLTQDHVIPLSKGGGYEIGNIVPACGPCNGKKGTGGPLKPVRLLLL